MIRINRTTPAPSILSTSTAKTRYRDPAVVQALLKMQHRKCCYCEVHIPDSGPGKQVEHFRPKSQFKELTYDWNNLLLACADCNSAKLDRFPLSSGGAPLLLNPSDPTLDPEDHIEFLVSVEQTTTLGNRTSSELLLGIARSRAHSPRGEESIRTIRLSGSHHVKRRGYLSQVAVVVFWAIVKGKGFLAEMETLKVG